MICRFCNAEIEPVFNPRPDTPHAGELRCPECDRFLGWKPKEKNEKKLEKRPACPTPADLEIDWCQVCLRKRDQLGINETLETHHIDDDPTNNDRLNFLVVCTMCHKWIAWVRLYVNSHLQSFYSSKTKDQMYEDMKAKLRFMDLSPEEYDKQILLIGELLEI